MNFCNQYLDLLANTSSYSGIDTSQLQPSQLYGVSATSYLVVNSPIHGVDHIVLINSDIGKAPYFPADSDVYLTLYSASGSPDNNVDIGHSVINHMVVADSKIITQDISILQESPDNQVIMGHFVIENTSTRVVTDVVAVSHISGLQDVTPRKVACPQESLASVVTPSTASKGDRGLEVIKNSNIELFQGVEKNVYSEKLNRSEIKVDG